jgi:DNA-binding transcriptional MerR regulator
MGTYKTSQIAKLSGIHVNTVRLYEQQRLIPEAPRAGNGYRLYGDLHLEHVLLVRAAFMSTWLGGTIRKKAYAVLLLAADGNHEKAMQEAQEHLALVVAEREKAETAVRYLESWAIMYDEPGPRLHWKTGDVCQYLNITRDTLRSWERNGLIAAQRDPDNGYRCYSENDLRRLYCYPGLAQGPLQSNVRLPYAAAI